MSYGTILKKQKKKNFKLKKVIKKIDINSLNSKTIDFLNWFSQYNLIPRGMALRLHLYSNKVFESVNDHEYEKYLSFLKRKHLISPMNKFKH